MQLVHDPFALAIYVGVGVVAIPAQFPTAVPTDISRQFVRHDRIYHVDVFNAFVDGIISGNALLHSFGIERRPDRDGNRNAARL